MNPRKWKKIARKERRALVRTSEKAHIFDVWKEIFFQGIKWYVIRTRDGEIWGRIGSLGRVRKNLPDKLLEKAQISFSKKMWKTS